MGELRKDPISGNWVILAENRATRPQELVESRVPRPTEDCDFCQGNEAETPEEVLAFRDSGARNEPGWRVRVVTNKYPAMDCRQQALSVDEGLFQSRSARGAHEVIIESPSHTTSVTDLSVEQFREALLAAAQRLASWRKESVHPYGLLFKNVGAAAGASVEHLHSQLIAMPVVPPEVLAEFGRVTAYSQQQNRCIFCDMIEHEQQSGERVVIDGPSYLAFCPYAGRFAYETWIAPKMHTAHFDTISPEEALELASTLRESIARLESVLDCPAYNYTLHTTPFDISLPGDYHWHIKLMPRIAKIAGLEFATGVHINTVAPERAATAMRLVSPAYPDYSD